MVVLFIDKSFNAGIENIKKLTAAALGIEESKVTVMLHKRTRPSKYILQSAIEENNNTIVVKYLIVASLVLLLIIAIFFIFFKK